MPKILICEDEKAIQNLFKLSFRDIYEIAVVSTGHECIDYCIKNVIDLIILDLGLPDIDGLNVIDSIRSYSESISNYCS